MSKHRAEAEVIPFPTPSQESALTHQDVKNILHDELGHFLSDIEFRLKQTLDVERGLRTGEGRDTVYAEDFNVMQHLLTGYTITANSPGAGSIAWTSLHIVYNGVDYTIADGNTAFKYATFVKPASYSAGTPVTLNFSNTAPTLVPGDAIIFFNNGGIPTPVPETTKAVAVADNTITNTSLVDAAVSGAKIADGGILGGKLGSSAINNANMFQGGIVGNTALGDGSVAGAKIADSGIGANKLGTGAINNAAQLVGGVVGNAALADGSVQGAKVADSGIGANKLGTGAINASTQFVGGVVGNAAIAGGAVTPAKTAIQTHLLF